MDWLYAAPFLAACLHITEEFFLPGGFADWDRRDRPEFLGSTAIGPSYFFIGTPNHRTRVGRAPR